MKKEHNVRLEAVMKSIQHDGMRLNQETKCVFGTDMVGYLGYNVSRAGIQPTNDKVKVLHEVPESERRKEL